MALDAQIPPTPEDGTSGGGRSQRKYPSGDHCCCTGARSSDVSAAASVALTPSPSPASRERGARVDLPVFARGEHPVDDAAVEVKSKPYSLPMITHIANCFPAARSRQPLPARARSRTSTHGRRQHDGPPEREAPAAHGQPRRRQHQRHQPRVHIAAVGQFLHKRRRDLAQHDYAEKPRDGMAQQAGAGGSVLPETGRARPKMPR